MSYTTYEFTAYTEADLLAAGAEGHSVSCGDTFTMSGTATTCFEVSDNDAFLSGDSYCNENANDHYGQQASITGENGQEIGNGGQIYAEKYFWVCDDAGNWYVLLQIEQEGTNEEYFTFFNGYGYETPAEGTELTVYSGCNVTSNWVDYKCLDAGEKEVDPGWIKGRLTLDADCNDNEWNEDTGQWDEGVEGQTVQLLDLDGNVVAESVTDSYGNYMFDVAPGQYRVKFPEIDGMKFSEQDSGVAEHFDSDADENGLTDVITVGSGQTIANIDAGVKPATGSIEGTVFADEDCDGLQGGEVCILGDNLVMNGDFEDNALNNTGWGLFDSLPGGWYAIQDKIEVQESNYGTGNTQGNAVVELDANNNAIICQQVDVPETCVYQFSIDYAMRGSDAGTNGFAIYIDGELQAEVFPTEGGFQNLTFEIELEAGATRIDLKGLGDSDCIGTVIDNVSLQKKTVEVAEPGVEGVIVVLTDANGDEVLDGNGDRIETVTDADGNYRFDDVVEGDYRVKFENPDGTDFTFQNVGDDDTIDSDVDGNGVSDVISVVADQTTSDVDAGLKSATGSIEGRVFCDEDCDGIDGTATSGKGDNLLVNSGFEHNTLNDSGYTWEDLSSGWYNIGTQNANILEQDYGHGNATGDAIAELECGVILCQAVNLDEAGSYCLSFDISRRGHVDQDNTFQLFIDGVLFETYVAQGQETIEIQLDLGAGTHRFDFKSLSQSYKGAGLDDVELRQEIDTVEPEPGKEGVVVVLLDANGDEVLDGNGDRIETVTDADGNYRFDDVVEGDYRVKFENPDGTEFTFQNVGDDDTIDSDVDGNGVSDVISVVADQTTSDVDAGLKSVVELGSIAGRYFCDENDDGAETDGAGNFEAGVAGATVWLLLQGTGVIASTTTDDDGNYSFDGLEAGNYSVRFEDPDDVSSATEGKNFIAANQGDDAVDSDVVDVGGAGNGNTATFTLGAGENKTDVDGGIKQQFMVCDDPDAVLIDFEGFAAGTVIDDEYAGIGVTISAQRATNNDAANDAMVFDSANPTGGDPDLQTFNQGNLLIVSEDNDSNDPDDAVGGVITFDFDNPSRIFDLKVVDTEEGGTVELFDADGASLGVIDLPNLQDGGLEQVMIDVDGVSQMVVTLNGSGAIDDICLVPGQPEPGSLSGRYFFDADRDGLDNDVDNGISGIQVELLDENGVGLGVFETTDAQGNYSFGDLDEGVYGVKFTDPDTGRELTAQDVGMNDAIDSDAADVGGGMSTINGITVVAGQDTPDNDAGVVEAAGSLSGTYFCDDDRNGADDGAANGDADIANKTVMLFEADGVTQATDIDGNPIAAAITDANGDYSFGNLAAGDYVVMFEATDGKEFIAANAAADDIDSDVVDAANGKTAPVTVVAGEETKNVDAGVSTVLGSLSGRYFCDDNRDGLDNDGLNNGPSDGVAGILVTLLDANNNPVLDGNNQPVTALTGPNGAYSFTGLIPGIYGVSFASTPPEKKFTTANVDGDLNDDIDSDAIETDFGSAVISGINVFGGLDTPDNDVGVFPNQPPVVVDDAGIGCADELIFVDFSDNFSDPASITMINGQAISQGQTVSTTIVNGENETVDVDVTLTADDQFVFNGEAAFAYLDIGQENEVTFTVKVENEIGIFAEGSIDVTFKGDANSYTSLADDFSFAGATYQVISGIEEQPFQDFAFAMRVDGTGDERFDGVVFENAYCLSFLDPAAVGSDFSNAPINPGDLLSAATLSVFNPGQVSAANGLTAAENLDLVSYIVAQDFEGSGTFSGWEVQFAIWELTDQVEGDDFNGLLPNYSGDNVDAIVQDAITNGEGFEFGTAGQVGAIIDPNPTTPENSQPFIIGFDFESYDCIC